MIRPLESGEVIQEGDVYYILSFENGEKTKVYVSENFIGAVFQMYSYFQIYREVIIMFE